MLRLFGLCSFLGGLMVSLVQLWFYYDPGSFIASYIDYVGYIFILFGIIGVYLAQYKKIGNLGLLIFIILIVSHSLWLGYRWFLTFADIDLRRSAPDLVKTDLPATYLWGDISLYSLLIGISLITILSLWKGVVSRIGSGLLLLGSLGAIVELAITFIPSGLLIPHAVIGVSFSWLGWSLFYGNVKSTKEALLHSVNKIEEADDTNKSVEETDFNEFEELLEPSSDLPLE